MAEDKKFEDKKFDDFLAEVYAAQEELPTKEEWERKLLDDQEMLHRAVKPKKKKKSPDNKKNKTKVYNIRSGGVIPKKPKFMKGGSYKGKSHMYAAGGMVKELKM